MVLSLLTWVVFLVFPGWAAYRLFRRGRSRHAWATVLTIPVGLGWLVGVYGLTRPGGEPALLEDPCPSCGGGEALQSAVTVDARTGERAPLLIAALVAIVAGLAVVGGGAAVGIMTWIEGDGGIIEWRYGSKAAGAAFLLLGLSFGLPLVRYGAAYFAAERVVGTLNRCVACGNTWVVSPVATAHQREAATVPPADTGVLVCSDGPEGCWGPVFSDDGAEPLCRGHLAQREQTVAPAHSSSDGGDSS